MADIPRNPIIVRPWQWYRVLVSGGSWSYNGANLTLLAPAAAEELIPPQYDYPLPPAPVWISSFRPAYLNLNLVAAPTPKAQLDWPRPLIFAFRADTNWLNRNVALLEPAAPAEELIPSQYDYPLPPAPSRISYAQNYPSPYALITVVTVNPFAQSDWPIPKQPYAVRAEFRRADISLLHSIKPPTARTDWPQIIPPPRIYAQNYAPPKALTFVQPVPFVQSNWPDPIQPYRVYAEARSAFIALLHSIKPFTQTDWPRPKLTFGGLTWTRGPIALQLQQPFNQENWPIPPQPYRVYAIVRRADMALLHSIAPPNEQSDWPIPTQPPRVYAKSQGTPATLFTAPTKPLHQDAWPAPTPLPRVYAEIRRADISLLHSIKPPNNQLDWPLPKLVRRLGETIAQPPHLAMLAKPFNQPDWPNPKQVLLPTSAQGWINRVNLALQIAPLPKNQFDWPIPKPSRPSNDRRTYIQAAPILLGIPEQPKPVKQDIWPVPVQPIFPVWTRQFGQGSWPTIGLIAPPLPRVPSEQRFRSPLQDDSTRPDVPNQRRPGVSAIRRPSNESPSSARDRSWRYE